MSSSSEAWRLSLEGPLGATRLGALRFELAAMLAARPREIELRVLRSTQIDGAGWGLLQAFFDVFWSRGGRLAVARGEDAPIAVDDLFHLRRVLGAAVAPQ